MVGADSYGIPRAPQYSGVYAIALLRFSSTRLSLSLVVLSRTIQLTVELQHNNCTCCTHTSHNPYNTTRTGLHAICLGSSQFAHHYYGNHVVFFSWHYLDGSVHAVRLFTLYIQIKMLWVYQSGFPHSEIFGSKLDWQLPETYGSLLPPSSPPDTKASTKMLFSINH